MQENGRERTRNTNSVDSSFTSIVWVLEAIDRTLVYWVFWLQIRNEDRMKFTWKKKRQQQEQKTNQDEKMKKKKAEEGSRKTHKKFEEMFSLIVGILQN